MCLLGHKMVSHQVSSNKCKCLECSPGECRTAFSGLQLMKPSGERTKNLSPVARKNVTLDKYDLDEWQPTQMFFTRTYLSLFQFIYVLHPPPFLFFARTSLIREWSVSRVLSSCAFSCVVRLMTAKDHIFLQLHTFSLYFPSDSHPGSIWLVRLPLNTTFLNSKICTFVSFPQHIQPSKPDNSPGSHANSELIEHIHFHQKILRGKAGESAYQLQKRRRCRSLLYFPSYCSQTGTAWNETHPPFCLPMWSCLCMAVPVYKLEQGCPIQSNESPYPAGFPGFPTG